jgi:integrase/recombinase XerD
MTTKDDAHFLTIIPAQTLPAVNESPEAPPPAVADKIRAGCQAWLAKSTSLDTRSNYKRDVQQFLTFAGVPSDRPEAMADIGPTHVAAWRDSLKQAGLENASIRRKMTALRSLFSYLQTYGAIGRNPAHGDYVDAPAVARDGKTVALSPQDCRRLLDAPPTKIAKSRDDATFEEITLPIGVRDRALFAVLAYTGCRVGELARIKVKSYKTTGVHRVLEIHGKGGKERLVPLHAEAAERLEAWLDVACIRDDSGGALFRPARTARGNGIDGFAPRAMTRRAVQKLVERYVLRLTLDPNVTVHSFRVTALTTAREGGSDIIDLQDFAGHADPRTTLTYIRSRDRLSKSPAYVLRY